MTNDTGHGSNGGFGGGGAGHGHLEVEVVIPVVLANILLVIPVKGVPEVVVVHTTPELTKPNQAGINSGHGQVIITLISSNNNPSTGDSISIHYPEVSILYSSEYNGMQVQWNYQSRSNDMQSLSWAYKLDEDFYGTSTSATQVDGNDSVDGSSWLNGLTADGGSHTLYVALLDQGSNVLATDSHGFTYQSGEGDYSTPTSGTQNPDAIYILLPTPQFPSNLSPKLWLDASNLTNADATWSDRSTYGNDATKFGSPVLEQHNDSGLNTMRYSGSGDYHQFQK